MKPTTLEPKKHMLYDKEVIPTTNRDEQSDLDKNNTLYSRMDNKIDTFKASSKKNGKILKNSLLIP